MRRQKSKKDLGPGRRSTERRERKSVGMLYKKRPEMRKNTIRVNTNGRPDKEESRTGSNVAMKTQQVGRKRIHSSNSNVRKVS